VLIEIEHRFGGHGGQNTEWEIRSSHADSWARLRELEPSLEKLIALSTLSASDISRGFCLLQGTDVNVIMAITRYVLAEEADKALFLSDLQREIAAQDADATATLRKGETLAHQTLEAMTGQRLLTGAELADLLTSGE